MSMALTLFRKQEVLRLTETRGIGPVELARMAGVDRTLVHAVVGGRRTTGPSARKVMLLLAALTGWQVSDLWTDAPDMAPGDPSPADVAAMVHADAIEDVAAPAAVPA